ncbi:M1 family metallopeptidase [Cesiribacter sp. SM1]|uniref:M1 family metallopeptidase n=1 Tax=Cesiribacter sp. SM1 TaxID=2861196 RepID=UPI001CD70613|nr:M1 family metallopeptidase [Cesiribacter sp. SM1]
MTHTSKFSLLLLACLLLFAGGLHAQTPTFTRQDSLRGSVTPERAWWDLTYYHLKVGVNPDQRSISGSNVIQYKVLQPGQRLQLDLQAPMRLEKVVQNGKPLEVSQEGSAYFITLPQAQEPGSVYSLEAFFGGTPIVAKNPPWDGGLVWSKDAKGKPFIANANQGAGASIWWPNKDHDFDEPDSMLISVRVPKGLTDVSNGQLRGIDKHRGGDKTYHWFVSNPINNYGVNINIADYAHFSDTFQGEKGNLDLNYYVLKENLEKAKEQFKQVKPMLRAFEHWFGPYPFYEDGYKLVEAPYLGMEHQSSVTYGNGYQNGYKGQDWSKTGHGLKFDFIIIHESAHEWFANNITNYDVADMWIHEGFTAYAENLYLEYLFDKKAGSEYVRGTRTAIRNDRPIIGYYGVNQSGSSDMYFKGANMLHTLRQIVNDDEKWRQILRGLNKEFYHQTVSTQQVESYLSRQIGRELKPFFDQYLRTILVPTLEYRFINGILSYRWTNTVPDFNMPVLVTLNGKELWLEPTTQWQSRDGVGEGTSLEVDPDFYVGEQNITITP